jgi:lipopolysaccharide export system protein LptA
LAVGLIAVLLLANWVHAADQDQPLYIEADSVELDEQQATSLYIGNVIVVRGTMRIEADRMLVSHRPDRQPKHITAWGTPANYYQQGEEGAEESRARALQMEYEVAKDEITLIDEAVLTQGNDRFSSDRIVYDRANARVKAGASAAGSERVEITIAPEGE